MPRPVPQVKYGPQVFRPEHQPVGVMGLSGVEPLEQADQEGETGKAIVGHVRVAGVGVKTIVLPQRPDL